MQIGGPLSIFISLKIMSGAQVCARTRQHRPRPQRRHETGTTTVRQFPGVHRPATELCKAPERREAEGANCGLELCKLIPEAATKEGAHILQKKEEGVSEESRSVSQFVDFLHINRYYQAQVPGQSSGLFWVNFRSILVFCSIKSNSQLSDWSRFQEMVTPDTSPEQRTR